MRIADLAEAIQQVDALPLGQRTVDRYMAVDQQSGAVFELDLAATSLRKGLMVELEPPTQDGRKCDLAVNRPEGGAKVFIEMQAIQDLADSARRDMAVIERMAPTFVDREVLGEIYRIPADDELDTVLPATDAFWERCKTSTEPEHLQLEDVIDVWAVPYSHPARAELLAAGVPGDFKGPVGDDPLRRTLRAIRSKIGQLPTDAPGVIVLRPPKLLLLDPGSLPLVVMAIQQSVAHAPQISAVALVGWAFKSQNAANETRIPMSGAIVIHEPDRHIFMRQVVLIPNSKRSYPAGDSIISLLF